MIRGQKNEDQEGKCNLKVVSEEGISKFPDL
jgi:hypothetical protein